MKRQSTYSTLLLAAACGVLGWFLLTAQPNPPLRLADPAGCENATVLVTALYDLHREDRPFDHYLPWFERTLQVPLWMVVFCRERRVADLAWEVRTRHGLQNRTIVVIEKDYPLKHLVPVMRPLLEEHRHYRPLPPEWCNDDYILLQFSKFDWLQKVMRMQHPALQNITHLFWVDAGISRFLLYGQAEIRFPSLCSDAGYEDAPLCIQTVYPRAAAVPGNETFFAQCVGCRLNLFKGGIFGGARAAAEWTSRQMLQILRQDMLLDRTHAVDNEQGAFALLYSRFPHRFRLLFPEADFNSSSLPCRFICL